MDDFQTALKDDAERLCDRLLRLLLGHLAGSVRALSREVRALETRVRLWLLAIAIAVPQQTPARPQKPKPQHRPLPAWLAEQKRAERSARAKRAAQTRKKPERHAAPPGLGFLIPRSSSSGPSNGANQSRPTPRDALSAHDRDVLRTINLARLNKRLETLLRLLANPSPALAYLAKKRRTAPETKSAPQCMENAPPADGSQSPFNKTICPVATSLRRPRAGAPKPDT